MRSLSAVLPVLAALLAISASAIAADKKPVGLRPIDYEAAREAARIERKPMLVLFCDGRDECRRVADGLLKEVKLRQWLDERVVAVQVDKTVGGEIAVKFRVRATPTYLFVDAKGVELDRLVGARDSKTLRAEGEEILRGGDPLERLQKRRKGRESDPEMRLRYADMLCDRGELDAALTEYLAVHAGGGPMGAAAFDEMQRLGRIFPKASEALSGMAGAIEPRVVGAEADDAEFARWFDLCRQLKLDTRMLRAYDALAAITSAQDVDAAHAERAVELRKRIAPALRDLFYTDRRYADLATLVADALGEFEARKSQHADAAKAGDAAATKSSFALLREDTARDFETLVAVRRFGEATLLADALIGFDPTVATYDALIEHALRAGSEYEATMLAQRGRSDARIDAKLRAGIGPAIPQRKPK